MHRFLSVFLYLRDIWSQGCWWNLELGPNISLFVCVRVCVCVCMHLCMFGLCLCMCVFVGASRCTRNRWTPWGYWAEGKCHLNRFKALHTKTYTQWQLWQKCWPVSVICPQGPSGKVGDSGLSGEPGEKVRVGAVCVFKSYCMLTKKSIRNHN